MSPSDLYEHDERGATAVEYGLMVTLIAVVIVGRGRSVRHQPRLALLGPGRSLRSVN